MKKSLSLVALILLAGAASTACADGPIHQVHGGHVVTEPWYPDALCKSCRFVPETKKVTKWCYTCKPEEYCAPRILPPCLWHWCGDWGETTGKVRTRMRLIKRPVEVEVPIVKGVVDCTALTAPCAGAGMPLPRGAIMPAPATFAAPIGLTHEPPLVAPR